ncbi:Heterogeneous nuclear ribonucleoprotein 27C [Lamellibrachia satsuma]|nr:Heterogeneous nuclear ribonucleoprotein 27C [Lamellibrachia satsuma]
MQYSDERGKVFVGGLSWDTTHASMLQYFAQYGEVVDCVVMKNQQTGKSRGFGFVTFKDPTCVDLVLSSGPHILDGRQIDPKACNPRSMNKGGKNAENGKKKVFVGGLPTNCTESLLKEVFSRYGSVADVVIMYDQQKHRSRGFGFLTFENEEDVERVCSDHFVQINGKQVVYTLSPTMSQCPRHLAPGVSTVPLDSSYGQNATKCRGAQSIALSVELSLL